MGKYSKRKKSFYLPANKKQRTDNVVVGKVGFLATCNSREDICIKEGYSLLNLYADKLYGCENLAAKPTDEVVTSGEAEAEGSPKPTESDEKADSDEDIESALKKEIATLQEAASVPSEQSKDGRKASRPVRRFQAISCGAVNNVFFSTTLADPLPVLLAAMDAIVATGEQRTLRLIRLLPVHAVCKAYLDKIEKTATAVCSDRFKGSAKSFYVVIKVLSNNSIKSEEILGVFLKVMQEVAPECTPVLTKDADIGIVVNVLVTNCYIGMAPGYLDKYKKYNLIELAASVTKPKGDDLSSVGAKKDSSEVGACDDALVVEASCVEIKEGNSCKTNNSPIKIAEAEKNKVDQCEAKTDAKTSDEIIMEETTVETKTP